MLSKWNAYHEAGHAVCLMSIGFIPEKVQIFTNGCGNTKCTKTKFDEFSADLISLSGTVAEHMYTADCIEVIDAVAAGLIPPGADGDFAQLHDLRPPKIVIKMRYLYDLLAEHWYLITTLANELNTKRLLSQKDIIRIKKQLKYYRL